MGTFIRPISEVFIGRSLIISSLLVSFGNLETRNTNTVTVTLSLAPFIIHFSRLPSPLPHLLAKLQIVPLLF